jgi:acetyl esterase/lipase
VRAGIVLLLLALGASGCIVLPPVPGQGDLPPGYVAPTTPVLRDIAYGPLPDQMIDLYLPPSAPGPYPVLVYMHGGGWVGGTHAIIPEFLLRQVTRANIALASVDYRVVGLAPHGSYTNAFPIPVEDVDRAIRYVRANAVTWNLDPTRIVLGGASAGATLAMLAAVAPGEYSAPDLPADLAAVSPHALGVLDFVGITDFATFPAAGGWAPPVTAAFLGCPSPDPATCDPATVAAASVANHLGPCAPPAFLVYGRYDASSWPTRRAGRSR